jgi:Icc-related predicted phosphoesterase
MKRKSPPMTSPHAADELLVKVDADTIMNAANQIITEDTNHHFRLKISRNSIAQQKKRAIVVFHSPPLRTGVTNGHGTAAEQPRRRYRSAEFG